MRCYLVTATINADKTVRRIAGTNALAKAQRDELVAEHEIKKKDVTIEDHEVPVAKDDLIAYVNGLLTELDPNTTKGDE